MQDSDLDDLLAAARADRPDPSPALMARVLDDAARLQPRPVAAVARRAAPRPGIWALLTGAFGGSGALAGMAAAGLAGVWVGVAQPVPIADLSGGLWGAETVSLDLFPDPLDVLDPEG